MEKRREDIENNPKTLRVKALKALELAKEQEANKLKSGATYLRVDNKTKILKNKL